VEKIDDGLRRLIVDLAETIVLLPGGGLAAPQFGHSLRLAVVDVTRGDEEKQLLVLINPESLSPRRVHLGRRVSQRPRL